MGVMVERLYEIDKLKVLVKRESVFGALQCDETSPAYQEILEEYDAIIDEMMTLAQPVGILGIFSLSAETATDEFPEGTPVLYGVMSIGDGIRKCSTQAFQSGNYVRGMLCDAIADEALFSLEGRMVEKVREVCGKLGLGIRRRLEAPHDISMQVQYEAWQKLELEKRCHIHISEGFMYDPVKTFCQVFVVSENAEEFRAEHDCRKCKNTQCTRRNVPRSEIVVRRGTEERTIYAGEQESLLSVLIKEGYFIDPVCGGRGYCGKCGIQVVSGSAPVTAADEEKFPQDKLEAGWRLSCLLMPTEDMVIRIPEQEEEAFEVLSVHGSGGRQDNTDSIAGVKEIAIDLGTTTLVMELLDGVTGRIIDTAAAVNNQRRYGTDVISRIQASVDGKGQLLQETIRKDLMDGIETLLNRTGVSGEQVNRISIAGNTTMIHLLMGYDCSTLGVYPFTPVNIGLIRQTCSELLGDRAEGMEAEAWILPGISAYVGGDIAAGLLACDFDQSESICLLVDLGTNGEMALGNRERILVASTAAGPAFEGGNITCGMGSVAGAVCSVEIEGTDVKLGTIGDKPPTGICGTGVIETAAGLVRAGIADETGLFAEAYFDMGFPLGKNADGSLILFTQKDMREVQLAKAAVRAGIETLLLRYGIGKEQIDKIYLAGGFGYWLDCKKAVAIGMFPEELAGRIEAVGNSSLEGAVRMLREKDSIERLERILSVSEEISLAVDQDFHAFYMDAMMFAAQDVT